MLRVISTKVNKPFQNQMPDTVSLLDGDREWEVSQGYNPDLTQTQRYHTQTNPNGSMSGTRQRLVQIGKAMDMLRQELTNLTQDLLDSGNLG